MIKKLLKYINPIKGALGPLVSIIGSGLVGAICLTAMTAGHLAAVSGETAASLAIFISYQTLGITIVKAGLDSYVFAVSGAKDSKNLFNLVDVFAKRLIPTCLAFGVLTFFYLDDFYLASICTVSIFFDSYSAIRIAEFTSLRRFNIVTIGSVLKYPLYFIVVYVTAQFLLIDFRLLVTIFAIVSLFRFGFIYFVSNAFACEKLTNFSIVTLGFQQLLNYLLFRIDQVSIPFVTESIPAFSDENLRNFVFLTKYPEIVSYVATAIGSVFFPKLLNYFDWESNSKSERIFLNIVLIVLCVFGLYLYLKWFGFVNYDNAILLSLVISAVMSFSVNYLTYRMLFYKQFFILNISLIFSVILGLLLTLFVTLIKIPNFIYWVVPMQMLMFLVVQRSLSQNRAHQRTRFNSIS